MLEVAIYDLYEIKADSIFAARVLIESVLPIALEEHDSTYYRVPHFIAHSEGGENLHLMLNLDPFEDIPHEDDYPNAKLLLYVNNTNRPSEFRNMFSKSGGMITLLRHEEI